MTNQTTITNMAADLAFTLSPMGRERRERREIAYAEEIERMRQRLDELETQSIRGMVPGWVCVPETEWDQAMNGFDE